MGSATESDGIRFLDQVMNLAFRVGRVAKTPVGSTRDPTGSGIPALRNEGFVQYLYQNLSFRFHAYYWSDSCRKWETHLTGVARELPASGSVLQRRVLSRRDPKKIGLVSLRGPGHHECH